jgi:hypothetical protein
MHMLNFLLTAAAAAAATTAAAVTRVLLQDAGDHAGAPRVWRLPAQPGEQQQQPTVVVQELADSMVHAVRVLSAAGCMHCPAYKPHHAPQAHCLSFSIASD